MRNLLLKISLARYLALFMLAAALAGCSANGSGSAAPAAAALPAASSIALTTSVNSIPTDNVTAATLTATLVDASNAIMVGVDVHFSTTSGSLDASTVTTDASGQAIVHLKSGGVDPSNRTATVTATVGGVSANVPVQIRGSTLALTLSPSTTTQVGTGTPLTATATAKDATTVGQPNQTIRFSIGAASTGAGTLSSATLPTDGNGDATPVTFTPTAAGTVVLTAEWLWTNPTTHVVTGTVTATATQNISVTAAVGVAFAITVPVANPFAMSASVSGVPSTQTIAATVPATIAGSAVTSVRFTATSGALEGITQITSSSTSILQTPILQPPTLGAVVVATYTAPLNSGSATVQVDALNAAGTTLTTLTSLTRTFVISAPAASAAKVFLSASSSTIPPSSGTNFSTASLQATVRDLSYNAVGGAAVMFGLLGTTGSGETVSPAVVYTDSHGVATATFTAGATDTLAAIYAQASIVGQTCAVNSQNLPPVVETNPLCNTAPLQVSSSAVSVSVGFGTAIQDASNTTQYKLPGSVLVVNSSGVAVAGIPVTLTAFPARYRNGSIFPIKLVMGASVELVCGGPYTITKPGSPLFSTDITLVETDFTDSEDINRNGILDDGTLGQVEDTQLAMTASQLAALAIPLNGQISPGHAAGGSVPMTVTTDSNGAATFYLQYPKSSAWFIEEEVTARVQVGGTESTARVNHVLPMSLEDYMDDRCIIGREANY